MNETNKIMDIQIPMKLIQVCKCIVIFMYTKNGDCLLCFTKCLHFFAGKTGSRYYLFNWYINI